ncbi:unnamed protein product, partial [Brassica rapa subsp. trilocularis]
IFFKGLTSTGLWRYLETMKTILGSKFPTVTENESEQVKGAIDFTGLIITRHFTVNDKSSSLKQDLHVFKIDKAVELTHVLSAPSATKTPIMETVPSNSINKEVQKTSVVDLVTTTLSANAFESPSCFSVLGDMDEAEIESMVSLILTRGGRETKPPIKYQDLEWKTTQGRRKHGPHGRGSKR